jgi:hypothetical protein
LDLSPRQRQIYDLRHSTDPPRSFRDIGRELGLAYETVRNTYHHAEDKLKNPGLTAQPPEARDGRVEYTNPELAAEMIDIGTNPVLDSLAAACKEAGLPAETTRILLKRLETEYLPVHQEVGRIKTDVLVREFEGLAKRALDAITDGKLDKTNAYQLALIAAIATDKRELLDGRPTERLSVEDRRTALELLPSLLIEAERRGYVREINPETGRATFLVREDAPAIVRTNRERMPAIDAEVVD